MSISKRIAAMFVMALAAFGARQTLAAPATPPAGSIFVSTAGSNTNDGLSAATPVKTIDAGIQKAFDTLPTTTGSANNAGIWPLFDAAVRWATNTATPVATPNNKALVVVRNLNLSNRTSDRQVVLRLQQLGYEVQVVSGTQCSTNAGNGGFVITAAIADTKNLIVICQGVAETDTDSLRTSTKPKISMNAINWDNFGMTLGATGAGVFAAQPMATQITVSSATVLNTAPGNAITTGDTTVYSKSYGVSAVDVTATSGANALQTGVLPVANVTGATNQICMFTAEAALPLSTAAGAPTLNPARFVGFFLFSARPLGQTTTAGDWTDANTATPPATNVVVATGTYPVSYGLGPFRNLKVQGGWNATFDDQITTRPTVIDAQNITRLVYAVNGSPNYLVAAANSSQNSDSGNPERSLVDNSTFDSLTLTNGSFAPSNASTAAITNYHAGGIIVDGNPMNVTFSNCTISHCTSYDRGGMVFVNTNFAQNTAFPTTDNNVNFLQCTLSSNTNAGTGAALLGSVLGSNNGPAVKFNRCIIDNNPVPAASNGGGVFVLSAGAARPLTITNCIITNNVCAGTGASLIRLNGGEASNRKHQISNNTIYNNSVTGNLIYMANNSNNPKWTEISNNIIANNTTSSTNGAIVARALFTTPTSDTFQVFNNLTFNNTGFAAPFTSSATIMGDFILNGTTDPAAANTVSSGNIAGDPLFVNASHANFHLRTGSPGLNTGHALSGIVTTDYDGVPRSQQGFYDIGAYERLAALTNAVRHWTLF